MAEPITKDTIFKLSIDVEIQCSNEDEATTLIADCLKKDNINHEVKNISTKDAAHCHVSAESIIKTNTSIPSTTNLSHHEEKISTIQSTINGGKMVRLFIKDGDILQQTLGIPCQILHYDDQSHQVTAYHVDEKRPYIFHISEIKEICA
ncbi:hypothetical protein [Longirhabdus pacifica]|uniref:hypothetical protein n=1 Tax=Longirhabdus pacifica TaxID=2305227 RepID=UPI0010089C0D|nr:hypothetical protein [Longirhabdus pacifica]